MPPVNARKPAIGFIFITLVLDVLGFGLLIPVAPRLIQSLLHGGAGGTPDEAARYVGALTATYAAMQFLFAPTLGALSDAVGRRPVILVSLFGSGLDYFAMALSPNLAILFVTRALNGISGASMTAASAYVADTTPPEKRAAGFGLIGAAFGLGFVFGPLLGGWLGTYDIRLPFYVAGTLCLVNWLYGLLVLPESLPRERRAPLSLWRCNPLGVFWGLAHHPLVARMAGALFMFNLAQFGLHATWALYTDFRYGWKPWQIGLSLFLVGIGAVVVQAGLARRVIYALGAGALGERRGLLLGMAIGVVAFVAYGAATQGWMIYVMVCAASLGGIAMPAGQALITKSVRPDEQGAVQGALTGLQSVANILGPLIGTSAFAYAISGTARPPLDAPGLAFFVSAIFAFAGLLIAAWATGGVGPESTKPTVIERTDAAPVDASADLAAAPGAVVAQPRSGDSL